jgi:hypothetical protein
MFERTSPAPPAPPVGLRAEIPPGAHVLWIGRPGQGLRFRALDIFLVPFTFLWFGFVAYIFSGVFTDPRAATQGGWFLLPFLAAGLYMLAGRFVVDAYRRSQTWYALTDREALIVTGGLRPSSRHVRLRNAAEISLSGDAVGSVRFGCAPSPWSNDQAAYLGAGPRVATFEFVSGARNVYALAVDAARAD